MPQQRVGPKHTQTVDVKWRTTAAVDADVNSHLACFAIGKAEASEAC
jgi:hypothetical protein